MKVKLNKTNITFTNVLNESLLDDILHCAEKSQCEVKSEDYGCKQIVSGNLDEFIKNWNSQASMIRLHIFTL